MRSALSFHALHLNLGSAAALAFLVDGTVNVANVAAANDATTVVPFLAVGCLISVIALSFVDKREGK